MSARFHKVNNSDKNYLTKEPNKMDLSDAKRNIAAMQEQLDGFRGSL